MVAVRDSNQQPGPGRRVPGPGSLSGSALGSLAPDPWCPSFDPRQRIRRADPDTSIDLDRRELPGIDDIADQFQDLWVRSFSMRGTMRIRCKGNTFHLKEMLRSPGGGEKGIGWLESPGPGQSRILPVSLPDANRNPRPGECSGRAGVSSTWGTSERHCCSVRRKAGELL